MIEDYSKYKFPDKAKKESLEFDVNYSKDENVFPCKTIRWKTGNKVGFIDTKHLFEFLFAIGNPQEQRQMIPQTVVRTKWYETVVGVKATRDIRKGEMINFPVKMSLPDERREAIAEIKHDILNPLQQRSGSGIIIPNK